MPALDNPRKVPFPQWGGSAAYARRLAAILPWHDVYVEPFCGAGGLFFAKSPVTREVLADLDPNVTFALRYIQTLTPRKLEALREFPWRVSHDTHKRAQSHKPTSPAARMWKHTYCRMATWGGKPTCRGYSTLHDGDVYNLDELWRFKERLSGATILNQDWKQTLRQFRRYSSALFFIDPPYVEEWNISEGVAPEEIATEVSKLAGRYLIAYTDSSRARRAFRHSGHQFKLTIMESRPRGAFVPATRLFVRSWDEDAGWLTPSQVYRELLRVAAVVRRR